MNKREEAAFRRVESGNRAGWFQWLEIDVIFNFNSAARFGVFHARDG